MFGTYPTQMTLPAAPFGADDKSRDFAAGAKQARQKNVRPITRIGRFDLKD